MTERLLAIVGASGAGRRVVDIASDIIELNSTTPFDSIVVLDDAPSALNLHRLQAHGMVFAGTCRQWLLTARVAHFSIGIGDSRVRQALSLRFENEGHLPAILTAPTARVSRHAELSPGCVISPGADISTNVRIGTYVHVMANAAVSHDVTLGNFVNINPGAIVAGDCSVGDRATIGAGAVILQGLTIGVDAMIGAGAVVTANIPDNATVKGVPAR